MRQLIIVALSFSLAVSALAQQAKTMRHDIELRLTTPVDAGLLEIQIPDVASGRSRKRAITDLMVRIVLTGGDIEAALLLPNGGIVDRDEGLFRAHIYIVSGGRLMRDAEARCDHWIADLAVCKLPCEGGAFGLKRRAGLGPAGLSFVVGKLPRGFEEGGRLGFNITGCTDTATEPELFLAPSGLRSITQLPLRSG